MADILSGKRVGFALTGSFCTFSRALPQLEALCALGAEVTPIFSEVSFSTDTRFGKACDHVARAEAACARNAIHTQAQAEPIGPKKLLDLLVVAPLTGATLSRAALGLTDSCVALSIKAQLRNERPVLVAVSTNDGLAACGECLGKLMGRRNVYFVPFGQDDPMGKPTSLVAHMDLILPAARLALMGQQMQPMILGPAK